MTHEERCGKDSLDIVASYHISGDEYEVIRWCTKCGAVVIDVDYDGRTQPGGIEPMRFPEMSKKTWALMDKYPPAKFGQENS